MIETFALASLDDTKSLAARLAPTLRRGDVLALQGDLGTGKTTFARHLIAALGGGEEAASPTFTLLQTYPVTLAGGSRCELHHYDLYRIRHPAELAELGLEEAFRELTLIEWPEKLPDTAAITLTLSFALTEGGQRSVRVVRKQL